jgi:hypothetical protein
MVLDSSVAIAPNDPRPLTLPEAIPHLTLLTFSCEAHYR